MVISMWKVIFWEPTDVGKFGLGSKYQDELPPWAKG